DGKVAEHGVLHSLESGHAPSEVEGALLVRASLVIRIVLDPAPVLAGGRRSGWNLVALNLSAYRVRVGSPVVCEQRDVVLAGCEVTAIGETTKAVGAAVVLADICADFLP